MAGKESTPKRFSAPAYYLHAVVCLLIMFGFGQLPPVEPLTPLGMNLIGIFLGVLYGWVCIEIVWPSLAGLLALMLIGGMKPMMLLNKSFGDPVVQMMFFIFVFCATISHYGLSKFISLWFITRKFVAGRPWVFTYTFLGSIFILGGTFGTELDEVTIDDATVKAAFERYLAMRHELGRDAKPVCPKVSEFPVIF